MKVVLGLGNPGKKYARTRHNMGFLVVDRIATENRVTVKQRRQDSLIGGWQTDGKRVLLVKPQTFMNHSGEAVRQLLRLFPFTAKDLIVIHDDLDLPFGRIRIRPRGGAGGHRGMLSILEAVGEEAFFRVRVGIGRPPPGVDPTDYVLEPFSPEERSALEQVLSRAAEAVTCLLGEGPQRAMEAFNRAG
ncbi:MAG: aminoacyl-tRNA hydrolase [Deltaproteobacteria bacterium]|nr:aminoacyl-tRNA hydrolase [Deltaproteobacteria bacterium]